MGQAKLRGTLEQRQVEGRAKRSEANTAARLRQAKAWASMSPKTKELLLLGAAFGADLSPLEFRGRPIK